jgi:hypothetical protein
MRFEIDISHNMTINVFCKHEIDTHTAAPGTASHAHRGTWLQEDARGHRGNIPGRACGSELQAESLKVVPPPWLVSAARPPIAISGAGLSLGGRAASYALEPRQVLHLAHASGSSGYRLVRSSHRALSLAHGVGTATDTSPSCLGAIDLSIPASVSCVTTPWPAAA